MAKEIRKENNYNYHIKLRFKGEYLNGKRNRKRKNR